jgi:hypothetical protein
MIFSGNSVTSTNITDCHNIAEILLKVALNTINLNLNTIINIALSINFYFQTLNVLRTGMTTSQ